MLDGVFLEWMAASARVQCAAVRFIVTAEIFEKFYLLILFAAGLLTVNPTEERAQMCMFVCVWLCVCFILNCEI